MKTSILKTSRLATGFGAMMPGLVALLLWGPPANAGERQIAEIRATMVEPFSPGEWAPTPSGNLRITGVAQVLKFEVTDPLADPLIKALFTGRFTWEGNANVDPELNGVAICKNTFEVGTWSEHGEFTPSPDGGMFVGVALATGNLLGPFELKGEAHGIAGELKGLNIRIEGQGDSLFAEQHYTIEFLDPKAKK
ncbi:MAG: hypothetical protein AB9869_06505 [Verrucomicrobiia bacterium]